MTLGEENKRWYTKSGRKLVPSDLNVTPITLTSWFEDDGCCSYRKERKNQARAALATNSFTSCEVSSLCKKLEMLGIQGRPQQAKLGQRIIAISSKESVNQLMTTIAPYIDDCCLYKLKWPDDPERKFEGKRYGPDSA